MILHSGLANPLDHSDYDMRVLVFQASLNCLLAIQHLNPIFSLIQEGTSGPSDERPAADWKKKKHVDLETNRLRRPTYIAYARHHPTFQQWIFWGRLPFF